MAVRVVWSLTVIQGFFGLVDVWDFAVQYQGKNERGDEKNPSGDNIRRSNGDDWGLSSSYESPIGVGVVAAYSASDRTDKQSDATYANGSEKAESWATALKYDANNVYLAAMYGESRNGTYIKNTSAKIAVDGFANKTQNVELVAQYQFDFGLRPSLAYVQSKGKDIEGMGNVDLVKYFDIGATYYFNKNMSLYTDYMINQLNGDNKLGINADDVVAAGLVYQF